MVLFHLFWPFWGKSFGNKNGIKTGKSPMLPFFLCYKSPFWHFCHLFCLAQSPFSPSPRLMNEARKLYKNAMGKILENADDLPGVCPSSIPPLPSSLAYATTAPYLPKWISVPLNSAEAPGCVIAPSWRPSPAVNVTPLEPDLLFHVIH